MDRDEIILTAEEKWEKTVHHFSESIRGIRTGRASAALVEPIRVDYYGAPTPLQQLASISVPEPRLIVIKPYDMGAIKEIEKAILKSEIGVTPANDGKLLRLPFPPLSEEQRKKLASRIKELSEQDKISLRNNRRDVMHSVEEAEKGKELTEDDAKRLREELQEIFKKYEGKIDELAEKKQKEVMEV